MKARMLLLCLSFTLLGSVAWTEAFLSQRNILAYKKSWKLATLDFFNPTIVSVPAWVNPLILQGYRLKSTPEFGSIRLLSMKETTPEGATLWFKISDGGYVDFILNHTESGHTTLRLSRSSYFPSALIQSSPSEKYESMIPIDLVPEEGMHLASIQDGAVKLNGQKFLIPELKLRKGFVGVQVSPGHAEILTLNVSAGNTSELLHFLPEGNRLGLYLRHWGILLMIVLLVGLIPRMRRDQIALFLTGAGVLVLSLEVLIGLDSGKTPDSLRSKFDFMDRWWLPAGELPLAQKLSQLKKDDSDSIIFFCRKNGCEKNQLEKPLPPKKGERILIFGGSQSKYGLIRNYGESIHFQFDRALRVKRPNIETINLSTPGFFRDRVRAYGGSLEGVAPDTIILEAIAMPEDQEAIRQFVQESVKRRIRVVYLRTPQNVLNFDPKEVPVAISELKKGLESHVEDFPQINKWLALNNLPFLRDIQKETGMVFTDPNEVFLEDSVIKSGQLFWDATHLTIYGQQVLAEWLAQEYLKLD